MRADCTRIYRTLADSKSGIEMNIAGWYGLAQLGKSTPVEAEMKSRLHQFRWLRHQELWSRDPDPLASSRLFTKDFKDHGQLEANLREADRLGIPRQPPADWQPRDARTLKLSSF